MFEESLLQACFNTPWHFALRVLKLHQLKAGVGRTPKKDGQTKVTSVRQKHICDTCLHEPRQERGNWKGYK